MKTSEQMSKTAILVEGGLMVAAAYVLSLIPVFELPWGGSITFFSTLPIIVMSLRHNIKWGVATALVYGVLQMFLGLDSVMIAGSFGAMLLCAFLDYLLGYACVGLTGGVSRALHGLPRSAAVTAGIIATGLMRLFSSFISGILIWYSYAPEGTPVWWYSLTYNAGWCLPDVAVVLAAALVLSRVKVLRLMPA